METYIWKLILCSSIFLGIYYLLLEKQKNHHFKRFYLLAALIFSLVVPLLSISYGVKIIESPGVASEFIAVAYSDSTPKANFFGVEKLLYITYAGITLLLFVRFCRSILQIRKQITHGETRPLEHFSLVLLEEKITPHSFLNYIFINKQDFETGKIDRKIIRHESVHTRQKHSIDLIFMELLLVFFWFNPVFYFYKKAILTNHEFLADDAVLREGVSVKDYQRLLFNSLASNNSQLTNSFNINNIKKRFKMMNTPKNQFDSWISLSTLPVAALMFFAFVNKVPAQMVAQQNDKQNKAMKQKATTMQHIDQKAHLQTLATKPEEYKAKDLEMATAKTETDTIRPKKVAQQSKMSVEVAQAQKLNSKELTEFEQVSDVTLPEYPGGLSALRMAIGENFDFSKMSGKTGAFSGIVWIMIPKNSSYPDLFFEFKDEAFMSATQDAVSKAMTEKWKPAMKDGKPVDYTFKLPITMTFQ